MSEQKIEQFWRPATAEDVARWMKGEDVKSRFWRHMLIPHEVYDPPKWYLNKPDPGEGYRLLEKFPPERKLKGDWYLESDRDVWSLVGSDGEQQETLWYRRQIESNIPEKPDSCDDQDISEGHVIPFKAYVGVEIILPNGKRLKVTRSGVEVL